ncbi:MAG: type II secretion system protein GspM [Dissulfurispiraceae bacterium]
MTRNRTLLISIPVIVILIGFISYQYGYLSIMAETADIREQQTIKKKTLEKYISLIAEKPYLEKKLASLKDERKADESKFIEGDTPSLAAARLQDTVKNIVTGRGGTISSERVGKIEDFGKFKTITVSLDTVLADSRVLADVLYSIETRTPYLVVKEVDTRVRNYRDPRELMVKIDVTALYGGK